MYVCMYVVGSTSTNTAMTDTPCVRPRVYRVPYATAPNHAVDPRVRVCVCLFGAWGGSVHTVCNPEG